MKIKRDIIYLLVIAALTTLSACLYSASRPQSSRDIRIYYSQDQKLNREIIRLTQDADRFVYFAVYTFTRQDIKDALLAAKYRGLAVIGITDRSQTRDTDSQNKVIRDLKDAGIPVYEQDHDAIMHLKAIVTDKGYASGSFNWTTSATDFNDEVLEVGSDPDVRLKYQHVLEELFKRYGSRPAAADPAT